MGVTNRLVFDVTDADTMAASSNIGAYVRAADGSLVPAKTIDSSKWLQVAAAMFAGNGTALTETSGALDVNIANTSIAITASDLDIRDLAYATDSVTAYQGGTWDVGVTSMPADVDIRDLVAATDSVTSYLKDGSGNAISSTGGSLDVNVTNDLLVSDVANTAIENTAKAVSTSAALLATEQAARKYLFAQNLGNKHVYVGKSGVSSSNGLQLAPGMIFELRMGPSVSLHAVSAAGTQDVRVMELS
jgi:hypothetical protein